MYRPWLVTFSLPEGAHRLALIRTYYKQRTRRPRDVDSVGTMGTKYYISYVPPDDLCLEVVTK